MYLLVIEVITIVDELAYSSLDQGDPGSNPDGGRDVEFQDPIIHRDLLKRNEELHELVVVAQLRTGSNNDYLIRSPK